MDLRIDESDMFDVTASVLDTAFGMPAVPGQPSPVPDHDEGVLAACVHVSGTWEGAVIVHCPGRLARRMAAIIFQIEVDSASAADVQDTLGEFANMVGGNLKPLVPGPSRLSLPAVVKGSDFTIRVPRTHLVAQTVLDCDGNPIVVSLLEREQ
jgi:chemotaxis protein CheX